MLHFLEELKNRNEPLFIFGMILFLLAALFFVLSKTSAIQVYQVSAWMKPFKFAVSLAIYTWTMAWLCYYLPGFNIRIFNLTVIILWTFEIAYIAFQAGRGQISHYNLSTPLYSFLYTCMALAASAVTIYTAYIGYLFFVRDFPELPVYYIYAIRLGILLFIVFSFQGFAMGSRLNHSVGAINENSNLFVLGWSKTVGDLRVAHFIGMHALQILPLASFYLLKSTRATLILGLLYALLAVFTLVQAFKGKPFIPSAQSETRV